MGKAFMMTDDEPVSPDKNPIVTLEVMRADPRRCWETDKAVKIMEQLGRTTLTRLQFIEFVTSDDFVFNWDYESESDYLPDQLKCTCAPEDDNDDWDYYIPTYLKKKRDFDKYNYWPTDD